MRPLIVVQAALVASSSYTISASAFVSSIGSSSPTTLSYPNCRICSRVAPLREAVATLDGKDIDNEFVPINNYVLVKVAEAKEQSDGGIILTGKVGTAATSGIARSCADPARPLIYLVVSCVTFQLHL